METDKSQFKIHFLAICTLFVLGNSVIILPLANTDQFGFLGFLISGIVAVGVCLITGFLPLNKFTSVIFVLTAFYSVGDAFTVFAQFIKSNLLPNVPSFFIVLPYILLLVYLAMKPISVIFKISLISAIISILIILLFFVSTLKDFQIENIFIYSLPTKTRLFNQVLPYFNTIVLPAFLLSIFGKILNFGKGRLVAGFLAGYVFLGMTVLNSVLLFGVRFSARLDYPYSSVGSTVTFGNLFTRLDGFIYFLYLASCLVKCAVGLYVIKKSRRVFSP